jgi:flavin reductase (DIM6/NTAB) family NADH-FMN oxidoreductase RutF
LVREGQFCRQGDACFAEVLRAGLRATAVNVSLLTTRDAAGHYHGLAVTTAVPFATLEPSMIVAVAHQASAYPAISDSGVFCLNQITNRDIELLDRFCRSDLRASRFASAEWRADTGGLPYLKGALASFFCRVTSSHELEDQTVFISRIEGVRLGQRSAEDDVDPLIWINGGPARLAGRVYA